MARRTGVLALLMCANLGLHVFGVTASDQGALASRKLRRSAGGPPTAPALAARHHHTRLAASHSVAFLRAVDDCPVGRGGTAASVRDALLAFHDAMQPDDWVAAWLPDWSNTTDPCDSPSWGRLMCACVNGTRQPTGIYMMDLGVKGRLPPCIGGLVTLTSFNFNLNRLTGSLPEELYKLSNLRNLDVSINRLSGGLSPDVSRLVSLETLTLHVNRLTGLLPAPLSTLTKLTSFDVSFNNFSGALPPNLSALINLRNLALSHNAFTGSLPPQWSSLGNLTGLEVGGNSLTGSAPASYAALKALKTLGLAENPLTGSLPPEWSALTHLQELRISNCHFSGGLPPSWAALTNLVLFEAHNTTGLCGPVDLGAAHGVFSRKSGSGLFINGSGLGTPCPGLSSVAALILLLLLLGVLFALLHRVWARRCSAETYLPLSLNPSPQDN